MQFSATEKQQLDDQAVENFREYLRIPSVHPDVDYEPCVKFLKGQAKELGLPVQIFSMKPGKPIVIMTLIGIDPSLPSILLNSHMDVVPVFEENWKYKPFAADMDAEGRIYARGAQDMKCVGTQYIETIRRLKASSIQLKRTLHLCFVPDEEIGGLEGMKEFVVSEDFKKLNVGCALDEGMANADDAFVLFYGERAIWRQPGHGSLLLDNTAGEKVRIVLDRIFEYREKERAKLNDPKYTIGDLHTLNVTQLSGGVQSNVVPPQLTVVIDCRIPVTMNLDEWEAKLTGWCREAGEGITMEFEMKDPIIPITKLDDSNPFWLAFKKTTDDLGLVIKPQVFPGGTDSRYVRELGIPALGFSPMNNTPVLLHDNDEYLGKDMFLKGIEIYCKLIPAVANC